MFARFLESVDLAPAQASVATDTPASPMGFVWLVAWIVCAVRRREEIGGWLLLFYIQLYTGLVFGLILFAVSLDNYLPQTWVNAPGLYALFLISTLPAIVIMVAQIVVAERLRRSRDQRHLITLKRILWTNLAFLLLAAGIDAKYFPSNIVLDVIALFWPMVWLPYFYRSKRVARVFVTRDWLEPSRWSL